MMMMSVLGPDLLAGRFALNLAAVPLRQWPPHGRCILLIHLQQQSMAADSRSRVLGSPAAYDHSIQCHGSYAIGCITAGHMPAWNANSRLAGAACCKSSGKLRLAAPDAEDNAQQPKLHNHL